MMCSLIRFAICACAGAVFAAGPFCGVEAFGYSELVPALAGALAYLVLHLQARRQKFIGSRRKANTPEGARNLRLQVLSTLVKRSLDSLGRCAASTRAAICSLVEASRECWNEHVKQLPRRSMSSATAVLDWFAVLLVHAEVLTHVAH